MSTQRRYPVFVFNYNFPFLIILFFLFCLPDTVPICMPQDNADFTGRMATVSGWGRLKYGGGVPSVLQEVQVRIYFSPILPFRPMTLDHFFTVAAAAAAAYATVI